MAFSLGGRPLNGLGVDARGFLLADFWFVLGAGIATAYCWKLADGWRSTALRIIVVIAAAALMGGHLQRAFDWATGWRLEQQLLAEAPVQEMKKMEAGAAVLLVKPFNFHGVPTLSAPWDINAAMSLTHPATAGHEFIVYNPWLGSIKWSGGQLAYSSLVVTKLAPLYSGALSSASSLRRRNTCAWTAIYPCTRRRNDGNLFHIPQGQSIPLRWPQVPSHGDEVYGGIRTRHEGRNAPAPTVGFIAPTR